jgi:hypothetical protein
MNDDALKALERARLMQLSNDFKKLGVECADNFQLVQRRDLERMKMNHIQKRRFLVAFPSTEDAAVNPVVGASNNTIAAAGLSCTSVDSVGLGDRRGCDECKELLESEQWLAL